MQNNVPIASVTSERTLINIGIQIEFIEIPDLQCQLLRSQLDLF